MRDFRFTIASVALAAAVCSAPCAAIAQGTMQTVAQHQVMATVHQFVDGINQDDLASATAACAPQSSVIDEFPPHAWQGNGCAEWAQAFEADNKAQGITGGICTLGMPSRVAVEGNTAYVVAPATFAYTQHGKPVTESGSTITLALKRIAGSWKIVAWAWAAH